MSILKNIEEYALNFLLNGTTDDIFQDRIKTFQTINSVLEDRAIDYLIYSIESYNIIKKKESYRILYNNCCNLLKKNKISQLELVLNKIENINLPKIYKYFFNKIKIKIFIDKFNQNEDMFDSDIIDYPQRIFIENSFDLEDDINNLIDYLLKICFDKRVFDCKYLNNNIINYEYFVKLLKYNLEIIPDIKNKYIDIYHEINKIFIKIDNSKKNNIPIKLITGF